MVKEYDASRFRQQVSSAQSTVKHILDTTRNPALPESVSHKYEDKYLLAEFLTNAALSSYVITLQSLGLDKAKLEDIKQWHDNKKTVTLRFTAEEHCTFLRAEEYETESPKHVTTIGKSIAKAEISTKVVTKHKDYYWEYRVIYRFFLFQGSDPKQNSIELRTREGKTQIKTTVDQTPRPVVKHIEPVDVVVTWLLRYLLSSSAEGTPHRYNFQINRSNKHCHTPRRNKQIDEAFTFAKEMYAWGEKIQRYFVQVIFPTQYNHGYDVARLTHSQVFTPVVPLFESQAARDSKVLPWDELNRFLKHQEQSFAQEFSHSSRVYPNPDAYSLITSAEAEVVIIAIHSQHIGQYFYDSVQYIEELLRQQFIDAIGKVVTPADFNEYMEYHNRLLYLPAYQPQRFCYNIRRPDHDPEGLLSIEEQESPVSTFLPVTTLVRHDYAATAMYFDVHPACRISFKGERYLHALLRCSFSGECGNSLQLVARARQFSCYVILIGTILSSKQFEPKHALLIENKDDLTIPLDLEQIPTPKQFRDAIESLSPEQQEFAKAFRSMQLASSLFGVCIIQIKPALEKLLRLPDDSLTKEIALMQDLMQLFIEYQIPSDLLSYAGEHDVDVKVKIAQVRKNADAIFSMIEKSKQREIEEARKKREMEEIQRETERRRRESELMQETQMNRIACAPMPYQSSPSYGCAPSPVPSASRVFSAQGALPPPQPSMVLSSAPRVFSSAVQGGAPQRSILAPAPPPPGSVSVSAAAPPPPAPVSVAPPPSAPVLRAESVAPVDAKPEVVENNEEQKEVSNDAGFGSDDTLAIDYTKIPGQLDTNFSKYDEDDALHTTTIKVGNNWVKESQAGLLSAPVRRGLSKNEQKTERDRAFDLLDALSRSGVSCFEEASLHVIVAATHCFDKTLTETAIQDNQNPIAKVERSSLIISSTIHQLPVFELIQPQELDRVMQDSPNLFD